MLFAISVDTHRVDQDFAFANLLLEDMNVDPARGVVAVRNNDERFLAILTLFRERNRLCHRVVHCRRPVRRQPVERIQKITAIVGPSLNEHRVIAEAVEE